MAHRFRRISPPKGQQSMIEDPNKSALTSHLELDNLQPTITISSCINEETCSDANFNLPHKIDVAPPPTIQSNFSGIYLFLYKVL